MATREGALFAVGEYARIFEASAQTHLGDNGLCHVVFGLPSFEQVYRIHLSRPLFFYQFHFQIRYEVRKKMF